MRPGCLVGLAPCLALMLLAGCESPLVASFVTPFERCAVPPGGWVRLPTGRERPGTAPGGEEAADSLPRGLRIVALGSSSTEGTGASAADVVYPVQLQRILDQRYPGRGIEVINKGVAGDVVTRNLARLNRDVLALAPDLVIWQAGTNDAVYLGSVRAVMEEVQKGIDQMRARGIALALMSSQALPDEGRDRPLREMSEALGRVADANRLPFLDRHRMMSWWYSTGSSPEDLLAPDYFHMNDVSYECLALRIADVLPALVRPRPGIPAPAPAAARASSGSTLPGGA